MFIVMGSTGNIGGAVARTLLSQGHKVTAITRSEEKAHAWRARGADAAVLALEDTDAFRRTLSTGRRAFLLNPPAAPATDTVAEERRTVALIAEAVRGSGLERVVVQSTYGARPGNGCGDLNVLHEFEEAIAATSVPTTVVRAGFYMSNWLPSLPAIRSGILPSMYPADLPLPMVSPEDVGHLGATLLASEDAVEGVQYIEGPRRYTPTETAEAFAAVLGRSVSTQVTPRSEWESTFRSLGFSAPAALSYTRMTEVIVDGTYDVPPERHHGDTTLDEFVADALRLAED